MNNTSLNTLRLWVLERHGTIKVHHAFLKIGRADSQVDNIASGGVGCPLEVETGRVMAGFMAKRPHETFTHHPDTGLQLLGRQLPFWPEVLAISCDALSLFPNMRFAGLDVAIAPDGPYVIELNVYPARRNAVYWDLPQKDFLEWALQPERPG